MFIAIIALFLLLILVAMSVLITWKTLKKSNYRLIDSAKKKYITAIVVVSSNVIITLIVQFLLLSSPYVGKAHVAAREVCLIYPVCVLLFTVICIIVTTVSFYLNKNSHLNISEYISLMISIICLILLCFESWGSLIILILTITNPNFGR